MKKVGVVLAGCGYLDGAEIQEAVATLLALEKRGFEVVAMAPNIPQMHVVNHRTNEVAEYTRNVFIESSRITRGEILELGEVDVSSLDAVVFPGGFGAAKNLCDLRFGSEMTVNEDVRALINEGYEAGKPMAFICTPVLAAAVLGRTAAELELTIGMSNRVVIEVGVAMSSPVLDTSTLTCQPHCIDTCVHAWTEHCSGIRGH